MQSAKQIPLEQLEAAQMPERAGIYWAKKSPAAEWESVKVAEIGGSLRAYPYGLSFQDYYLREFYEWGPLVEQVPQRPDSGLMEAKASTLWARRKEQRAELRSLKR